MSYVFHVENVLQYVLGRLFNLMIIKKIDVDYSRCIRCYCCHEVCPADAIDIEQKGAQ